MEAAAISRVQTLVESGLSQIPSSYIQPPQHRPNPSPSASGGGIPVVDLSSAAAYGDLPRACREWGAFQVVGHGVPLRLLDAVRSSGLRFFESPQGERIRYACDPASPASEGYGSRMLARDDGVLDWRDYFDHHTLPESRRNPSRWPHFPPSYRTVIDCNCKRSRAA